MSRHHHKSCNNYIIVIVILLIYAFWWEGFTGVRSPYSISHEYENRTPVNTRAKDNPYVDKGTKFSQPRPGEGSIQQYIRYQNDPDYRLLERNTPIDQKYRWPVYDKAGKMERYPEFADAWGNVYEGGASWNALPRVA